MQTTVKKALLLLSPSLVGVLGFYVLPVLAGGVFTLWSPAQGFLGLRPFAPQTPCFGWAWATLRFLSRFASP
mgnify:CR=1 FL=1